MEVVVVSLEHVILLVWNVVHRIDGVIFGVLASSAVDRGFEPYSGQTKDYEIGICCFSAKNHALRSKGKDWLSLNQEIVSEWSNKSFFWLISVS